MFIHMYTGTIDFDDTFYKKKVSDIKQERKINTSKYLLNLFLLVVVTRQEKQL